MYIINTKNKVVKLTKNVKPRVNIDWNEANQLATKQGFQLIPVKESIAQMHKSKLFKEFMIKYWTWNKEQLKKGQTIKDVTGFETNSKQWISTFKASQTESFGSDWDGYEARPGVDARSPLLRSDFGVAVCVKKPIVGKLKKSDKTLKKSSKILIDRVELKEMIRTECNRSIKKVLKNVVNKLE